MWTIAVARFIIDTIVTFDLNNEICKLDTSVSGQRELLPGNKDISEVNIELDSWSNHLLWFCANNSHHNRWEIAPSYLVSDLVPEVPYVSCC